MSDPLQPSVHRVPVAADQPTALAEREWLVANGIGGYASASIPGLATRKYHGLLVAALADPLGRTVMLNHLAEYLTPEGGDRVQLSGKERTGQRLLLPGIPYLRDFRLETGLPAWVFAVGGAGAEFLQASLLVWRKLHPGDSAGVQRGLGASFPGFLATVMEERRRACAESLINGRRLAQVDSRGI